MRIIFQNANGERYAGSPQTEKRGDQRSIRFAYAGCTHYLLFRAPLDVSIDLEKQEVRDALEMMGGDLLYAMETEVPGVEKLTVTCVAHTDLYRNNGFINIKDEAANYGICGVFMMGDQFQILMPLRGMAYTTAVAVELSYTLKPYVIEKKGGLFRRATVEKTDFYQVNFEKKTGYVNGTVYYTIGRQRYRFPVVEEMMGKTVLIRTNQEIPEFFSTTPGVILKKK